MNQFDAALWFYRQRTPEILATAKNEWAGDPYAWAGVIRMTPIEEAVWSHIRDANVVLYPQYPVGRYFVDFGHPVAKVAIECDGRAYHTDKARDAARDAALAEMGWVTYRVPGYACVEERGEDSAEPVLVRQLIDAIGEGFGIRRSGSRSRPLEEGLFDLVDFLVKVNT